MQHNNRTALIGGALEGIGYEISKLFAWDGYNILLVARREERLKHIANELSKTYSAKTRKPKDLSRNIMAEEIYDELKKDSIHTEGALS